MLVVPPTIGAYAVADALPVPPYVAVTGVPCHTPVAIVPNVVMLDVPAHVRQCLSIGCVNDTP